MAASGYVDLSQINVPFLYSLKKSEDPQPAFTCWKLTIETLEQGVKYV